LFSGWPPFAKTKTPQASGNLRRFVGKIVLSQPQARARQPKPIKEIPAAACVFRLRAVHDFKITESLLPSNS
jgi:hypothetical protein